MEIISDSLQKTKKTGEILAKEALRTKSNKALVFLLKGDLGSGKTSFVQGFAKGLGIKEKITSPTFVLMKNFEIKKKAKFNNFFHIDCYRIKNSKEIIDLKFQKIVSSSENIIIIEWPDKIKKLLPKNSIIIKFKLIDLKTRKITLP